MGYQQHLDFFDPSNDPDDACAPPTPEEQQAMMEAIGVMQAVALLRERGFAVVEPVDVNDEVVS